MEKINRFPCTNCRKITGAQIVSKEKFPTNKEITVIKVIADCCGMEFTEHYTKFDLHHHGIKDVEEAVLLNN
ncbi:MAG: hypothetical protein NT161_02115 [Candidatus Nomurabacteria bacterium]|nr:hypothetical protein [Candidatus Nomurabacteria bacterium]